VFILFPAEMASKTMWSSDDYIEYSPLFPNPVKCVKDMIVTGANELYLRFPWKGIGAWLTETKKWVVDSANIDAGVIFYPVLFAVLFTILRQVLTRALFRVGIKRRMKCVIVVGLRLLQYVGVALISCLVASSMES
jgi:hypothetical protein